MTAMNMRQKWLVGILLATVVATWLAPDASEDLALPPAKTERAPGDTPTFSPRAVAAPSLPTSIAALHARTAPEGPLGLFSPLPPPSPPVPETPAIVVAPEPPQAPPLPFRYLGRYREGARDVVFVSFNERSLVLAAGDVVEGMYRVQSIEGGAMRLVYLPLKQMQILEIGPPL